MDWRDHPYSWRGPYGGWANTGMLLDALQTTCSCQGTK